MVTTKEGLLVATATNDDQEEIGIAARLQNPQLGSTEGFDPVQLRAGMSKDMGDTSHRDIYDWALRLLNQKSCQTQLIPVGFILKRLQLQSEVFRLRRRRRLPFLSSCCYEFF